MAKQQSTQATVQNQIQSEEELLNVEQVLAETGISRMTLNRRIKEGAITPEKKPPGLKRAHRLLFKRSEVNRFKNEG